MFLLEKEVNGITLKTEFEFDDKHIKLVKDVLKCLEDKTVDVPTGNESNSFTSISILEWFPVVCKKVMIDGSGGSYITVFNPSIMTHAMKLLLTVSDKPISVDVFIGEIKLSRDVIDHDDAFCFALAHEIQHAINALNFAYPALTNWKGFLGNIIKIKEVINTKDFDQVTDRLSRLDMILDKGSLEERLEMLRKSFGSSINIWQREYIKFVNDVIVKQCPKNP